MRLRTINSVRVVKVIQLLLYFTFIYSLIKNHTYLSIVLLAIGFSLELFIPNEYGWGIKKSKKNIFIKSDKVWMEPLIVIFFLLLFIIITYLYIT